MIKILVVEDSLSAQEFLVHILQSDPVIQVVGIVNDGIDALQAVREKHPDVVTMDIHMPKMDGFMATRLIMENEPTPIVIVSASSGTKDIAYTFQAIEAGALAIILRPPGIGHPDHKSATQALLQTVKLMSEIRMVRRIPNAPKVNTATLTSAMALPVTNDVQLVAIGASTGGPQALYKILLHLKPDLPVPLIIVQHITPGFTEGLVGWLASASGFPVHIAVHGQQPLPGHGYFAPDGFHIGISSASRIVLSNHAPESGLRPSVAFLFHTVAQVLGWRAVGVLLTGMGRDGAKELLEMKNKGALTIAQDEISSIVFGMPGEAVKLGAATFILTPEEIAVVLANLVKKSKGIPR